MLWVITLLLALASCLTASEPLPQAQSRSCLGSLCFGKSKTKPIDVTIPDLESLINKDVYEGDEKIPLYTEIPLITWKGSTRKRHLRYRAWRTESLNEDLDDKQKLEFMVYLELQVASRDNLWIHFNASYPMSKAEPGVNARRGWAPGNPSYSRRTIFTLRLPTNAGQIDYHFDGTWWRAS
ncbi:hypothetical protein CDEST_06128 [Colletotrichum destructivum]|uniref:Uncharacterized protein n=1 Tax=Colletotrichum destructivum TaxID=34406 RepID=A0AAX4IDR1_9PEZI|nr:hypothetical protein CDEST_06128 [Colletotrichum destructivum]